MLSPPFTFRYHPRSAENPRPSMPLHRRSSKGRILQLPVSRKYAICGREKSLLKRLIRQVFLKLCKDGNLLLENLQNPCRNFSTMHVAKQAGCLKGTTTNNGSLTHGGIERLVQDDPPIGCPVAIPHSLFPWACRHPAQGAPAGQGTRSPFVHQRPT